jgi:hypothetical protein
LEEESPVNVKIYNLSVEVVAVEGMVGAPKKIWLRFTVMMMKTPNLILIKLLAKKED